MNWYKISNISKEAIKALSSGEKELIEKAIKDNPDSGYALISKLTKIKLNYVRAYMIIYGHMKSISQKIKIPSWKKPENVSKIMSMYNGGVGIRTIAKYINMPYSSVYRTIIHNKDLSSIDDYVNIIKSTIWDDLGIGFKEFLSGYKLDNMAIKYIGSVIDRLFENSTGRDILLKKFEIKSNFIDLLSR